MKLTKSMIISARQCAKRLHLEVHRPEVAKIDEAARARMAEGREVGRIARRVLGKGLGYTVPSSTSYDEAVEETRRLLAMDPPQPIFEGAFESYGVRVRADALLPVAGRWHLVEVKSSTSVKSHFLADVAIQWWVLKESGVQLDRAKIAVINSGWSFTGDGAWEGLFRVEDVTADVLRIRSEAGEWVSAAESAVGPTLPDTPVGKQCRTPHPCPFEAHCWLSDTEYPVTGLGGSRERLAGLVHAGATDIRDVPDSALATARHRHIARVTKRGTAHFDPGLTEWAKGVAYPRYYLDFESVQTAVPIWPGTCPYQQVPFQWSCHVETTPGQLGHREYLHPTPDDPRRAVATHLLEALGETGPILTFSHFEKTMIRGLARDLPELADDLKALIPRLEDMLPPYRRYFYAPSMLGSWSLKSILPAIGAGVGYEDLDEIADGQMAAVRFRECIAPDTPGERRDEIRRALLAYCKLDTEAMVRLMRFAEAGG